jgi:hypothetical protein
MLELNKAKAVTPIEKQQVNRTMDATYKAIDQLVYNLYNLIDDEILIVMNNKTL